jgi:transglutaminase-like putative cysteine protease
VIYDVSHVTRYSYEARVASSTLSLRVTPRDDAGQHCLDHALSIMPEPRSLTVERDFFGNTVTIALIETSLIDLHIEARSRVDVSRPPGPPANTGPDLKGVVNQVVRQVSLGADSPVHFIFPSPRIPLRPEIGEYAATSFVSGRTVLDGARELAKRIRKDFKYQPNSTAVSTPVEQAFEQRRGVCQDFAHIMIAGLRSLGVPASYVSGYIRTIPPPGRPRLAGADATHAWVSVWCGEELRWIGIDPTNAMDVGNDHILLAIGRDFSDVSPIYGVFLGSGAQELEVGVDVVPVASPPAAQSAQ